MKSNAAAFAALVLLAACASGPAGPEGPASALNQAERLLTHARKIKAEKGCAEAAPTFRVVAGFGQGYEIAQHELGACLLEMTAGGGPEAALFREEALFWLRRAAWAGEARAQWTLANVLSGSAATHTHGVAARPAEALGWALVYEVNAVHELYGLARVNPAVLADLSKTLPAEAVAEAETFAADFEPVTMALFSPPPRENADRRTPGGYQRRRGPN